MNRSFPLSVLWLLLVLPCFSVTFQNPRVVPIGFDPRGMASADFNGDGRADLVYVDTSFACSLHVLLGRGDGTLVRGQDLGLPPGICGASLNLADVNGDLRVDVLIASTGQAAGEIAVLFGNGDGTFQAATVSEVTGGGGNFPNLGPRMGIGDLNGDGKLDIAVADQMNNQLYSLLGDGTGKFTVRGQYFDNAATSVYLSDLNGDGRLDVLDVSPMGGLVTVRFGLGDGTFTASSIYSVGAGMQDAVLGDLDGDGHPDVIGNIYPGQIFALKGRPDGTFASPVLAATISASGKLARVADVTGDGRQDLLVSDGPGIGVLAGNGTLVLQAVVYTLAAYTNARDSFVVADFNQDGKPDVAIGVRGAIVILEGHGNGSFTSGDFYDFGKSIGDITVGDFNRDGNLDVAGSIDATFPRVFLGNGTGFFTLAPDPNTTYGDGSPPSSIGSGDFDGDGSRDIVIIGPSTTSPYGFPQLLSGKGDGSFHTGVEMPNGSVVTADLNNDGRDDMVVVGQGSAYIIASLGQPGGTFAEVRTALRNPTFAALTAIGDLNGDGKKDLIIAGYQELEVWLGSGDGHFSYNGVRIDTAGLAINNYYRSAVIVDYDGDGHNDLLLTSLYDVYNPSVPAKLRLYGGNGDGSFRSGVSLPLSHFYQHITAGDLNRDGLADLVLDDDSIVAVLINLGGGNFDQETPYVAGRGITSLTLADVNRDGYPDIVNADVGYSAIGVSSSTMSVLLNDPAGVPPGGMGVAGSVLVSPEPSDFGSSFSVTFTGRGAQVPTGSVTFSLDGTLISTVTLSQGTATASFPSSASPGVHNITAAYSGDAVYRTSTYSRLHTVTVPVYPTQTVLNVEPAAVFTSETVRLLATVTSSASNFSGIVTFYDQTRPLGSAVVDRVSGVALFDTSMLEKGLHQLKAIFNGNRDRSAGFERVFAPSTSAVVQLPVNAVATSIRLTPTTTSAIAGTIVTLRSEVSSTSGRPFGGVSFHDGNTVLGTVALRSDGTASFSTASLSPGTHSLSATFNANAVFDQSTSNLAQVTITSAGASRIQTITTLAERGSPTSSLAATVLTASGVPAGEVTFIDKGEVVGKAPVDGSGNAVWRTGLLPGQHAVVASFVGDPKFAPSVSSALEVALPEGGEDFQLQVLKVASGTYRVAITASPSFAEVVHLSCNSSPLDRAACNFAPLQVRGSGTSVLTVQANGLRAQIHRGIFLMGTFAVLGSFVSLSLSKSRRYFLLGLVLVGLACFAACGSRHDWNQEEMTVVTVRASTASERIVHSMQIIPHLER